MPYFLVGIRGDPARAEGMLALNGIQNLVADEGVTARLAAEDGERAVGRVRAALAGEPFTIEDEAREEPGEGLSSGGVRKLGRPVEGRLCPQRLLGPVDLLPVEVCVENPL